MRKQLKKPKKAVVNFIGISIVIGSPDFFKNGNCDYIVDAEKVIVTARKAFKTAGINTAILTPIIHRSEEILLPRYEQYYKCRIKDENDIEYLIVVEDTGEKQTVIITRDVYDSSRCTEASMLLREIAKILAKELGESRFVFNKDGKNRLCIISD